MTHKNIRIVAVTGDDITKNIQRMKESWTTVLVVPTIDILEDLPIDAMKTSINIMTGAEYMAACNWHVDE